MPIMGRTKSVCLTGEENMLKVFLAEDEFIELGAYTIEELKGKIFSGEIEDAKTVSSLMAYAVKYGK